VHPYIERANLRHYQFLIEGVPDIAGGLQKRRVGFVLRAFPDHSLFRVVDELRPSIVVGDENPLRQFELWRQKAARRLRLPFWTVDADVVVPSKLLEKEQYAARTIRPRIQARLATFLASAREPVARVPWTPPGPLLSLAPSLDLLRGLPIDRSVGPVGLRGGTSEARRQLARFLRTRLEAYDTARNQPEISGTSHLSPYLHFGHIGPREVARAVWSGRRSAGTEAFIEQLVVRRELAINFVTFNRRYDRLEGCEVWARQTLAEHRNDSRPYRYGESQLEAADTHDPLWNAAQAQMVTTGWMHGYVRMYWAKKILEWSRSPREAFRIAVALNDRYELDGRDPNGYANIAWAICGKHDRPWPERDVFGTVRSMTYESTSRKFDSKRYIRQIDDERSRAR
jgi:deoxyribodipyrimidine photo-lyase